MKYRTDCETIEDALASEDWRDRLVGEFNFVREKENKLYGMLLRYADGTLDFKPHCSIELLTMQLNAMSAYSAILEIRLNKEGINGNLRNPEQFLCGGGNSNE